MNEIQVFENEEFGSIRSIIRNDEPWFIAKDLANILGYKDTAKALTAHVDDEDKHLLRVGEIPTLKINNYGAYIINESGLYSLILSSKLPTAKKFKRWVTSEVLPAIRKNGSYALPQVEVLEDEPQTLDLTQLELDQRIKIASIIASCRRERLALVAKVLSLDVEVMHQPITTNEISDEELIQRFMDNIWEKLDDVTPNAILYAQYQNFCRENGCVPRTKNGFGHYVNKNYPIAPVMTRIKDRGVCIRCRGIRKLTKTLQEGGALA